MTASVPEAAARDGAPPRSRGAGSPRRSPGSRSSRARSPSGRARVQVDEPDRLLRRASVRARRPRSTETATSAPSDSRAPAAIAAAVSAETAPCASSVSAGTPSCGDLDVVLVRDDPAAEDVARARESRSAAPRRARRCTTPRSRASSPRARQRPARAPRPAARPRRTVPLERAERASSIAGAAPPPLADEVDVDLEVMGADRRLDPVAARRRPPRARARPPTRSRRRAQHRGARGGSARASTRRTASSSSAACHSRRSSGGGPGRTTATRAAGLDDEPGRRPGDPDHPPALGNGRLLAHAGLRTRA